MITRLAYCWLGVLAEYFRRVSILSIQSRTIMVLAIRLLHTYIHHYSFSFFHSLKRIPPCSFSFYIQFVNPDSVTSLSLETDKAGHNHGEPQRRLIQTEDTVLVYLVYILLSICLSVFSLILCLTLTLT